MSSAKPPLPTDPSKLASISDIIARAKQQTKEPVLYKSQPTTQEVPPMECMNFFGIFVNEIVLYELSTLLNTNLDRQSLSIIVQLCELGVNPEAISAAVKELRREAANINAKP